MPSHPTPFGGFAASAEFGTWPSAAGHNSHSLILPPFPLFGPPAQGAWIYEFIVAEDTIAAKGLGKWVIRGESMEGAAAHYSCILPSLWSTIPCQEGHSLDKSSPRTIGCKPLL